MSKTFYRCTSINSVKTPSGSTNYQIDHAGLKSVCIENFKDWCEKQQARWAKLFDEATGELLATYAEHCGLNVIVPREIRTEQQIVDEANELARTFYGMHGCVVPASYKFYAAHHPAELGVWNMAVSAYEHIEGTDVESALEAIEEGIA